MHNSKIAKPIDQAMLASGKRRLVVGTCLAVYLVVCFALGYVNYCLWINLSEKGLLFAAPVTASGDADVRDFTLIYASGLLNRQRLSGRSTVDVYDPVLLTQTVEEVIAPLHPVEMFTIQYPPILFLFTTPVAYFSLLTAWWIWNAFSLVAVTASYALVAYRFICSKIQFLLGLLLCLVSRSVLINFQLGQTAAIELFFVALTYRLLGSRHYFFAGMASAASFLKFQFAAITFIPGICLGRKSFAAGFALMALVEYVVSIFVVGSNNIGNFIKSNYLSEVSRAYYGLNEIFAMANFRGLLAGIFVGGKVESLVAAACYLALVVSLFFIWIKLYPQWQARIKMSFELTASLTISSLVPFALHEYLYDYVLLIPACIWLFAFALNQARGVGVSESERTLLIVGAFLFVPVSWLQLFGRLSNNWLYMADVHLMFFYCLFLLYLSFLAIGSQLRLSGKLSAEQAQ